MKNAQLTLLRTLLGISDLLLLNMCLFLSCYISHKFGNYYNSYQVYMLPANALWVISTGLFSLYGEYTVYKLADIYKATWRSLVFYAVIFEVYLLLVSSFGFPTHFVLTYYTILVISFILGRVAYIMFNRLMKFDFNLRTANVLAIASIGGHWIELLRLMPLFKEHEVAFISNRGDMSKSVECHKFYEVPDANKDQKLNIIKCFISLSARIIVLRPRVIITTGAAPGLIGILIGRILGIKTIWIDSIANVEELSLSGRIAIKIADRVYTQWEHLATPKIIYSGTIL